MYEHILGKPKDKDKERDHIKEMIKFISKNLDSLSRKDINKFERIKLEYNGYNSLSTLDEKFLHSCVYKINNDV